MSGPIEAAAPPADGPKRVRMSGAARRDRIMLAARELFTERGYSGAHTKDIAQRSGVTEPFLYRHFSSKDEMYTATVLDPLRRQMVAVTADVEELFHQEDDPIEFVRQVHRRCLEFYVDHAALFAVAIFGELESGRQFYNDELRDSIDRIGRLIAARAGWSERGIDSKIVRRSFFGAQWVIGLNAALRHRKVDIPRIAENLTQLFTAGINE
jgi:TetR/AcrR family transcriptional regulator